MISKWRHRREVKRKQLKCQHLWFISGECELIYSIYCPKCDLSKSLMRGDAERLIRESEIRDKYNSNKI